MHISRANTVKAPVVERNWSTRRSRGQCEPVVYWVNQAGDMMLAPHTDIKPFNGWRRVEATTVAEIEQFSRKMAHQELQKARGMKVEEHLRLRDKRERQKANLRLKIAKGDFASKLDEDICRNLLKKWEKRDEDFYKMLYDDTSLLKSNLWIEAHESPTGAAHYSQKKVELA